MIETITIRNENDEALPGLLVRPEKPNGCGVVLAMSVWGLNTDLCAFGRLLAGLGYFVVAPNLFWRLSPEHGIDYDFSRFGEVGTLMRGSTDQAGIEDLNSAAAYLRSACDCDRLAVVGWCYGGRIACLCAVDEVFSAVVAFYPTTLETRLDIIGRTKAPVSIHLPEIEQFGTHEDSVGEIVNAFAGETSVDTFVYSGVRHGFGFSPPHPNFDRDATRLADARAVLFLKAALRS